MKRTALWSSLLFVSPAALVALAPSTASAAIEVGLQSAPGLPEIVGGQVAAACQWPTVTAMTSNGDLCTGTLVHPQLVLYAAHCPAVSQVTFNEVAFSGGGQSVPVDHCMAFGGGQQVGDDDYAYCKLAYPVNDVPLTPVAYGCEVNDISPGVDVVISGFGQNDLGNSGTKYWAATTVSSGTGTSSAINVGGNGTSAWQGDSGGPAFIRLEDGSWRAFGIVSGGTGPGQPVLYVNMAYTVPWVESNSGVDITPCHDPDGIWNPGPTCGGFSTEPLSGGTWSNYCKDQPISDYSATCGPPWNAAADEIPPVVSIVTPVDGDQFEDAPALIDINIDATDEGYGVKHVWISVNGEDLENFDNSAPYGFPGANFPEGGYTIVAYAEDIAGNISESDPVSIGVGGVDAPSDDGGDDGDNSGGTGGFPSDGSSDDKGCSCDVGTTAPPRSLAVFIVLLGAGRLRRRRSV